MPTDEEFAEFMKQESSGADRNPPDMGDNKPYVRPIKTAAEIVAEHNAMVGYEPSKMTTWRNWNDILPLQKRELEKEYHIIEKPNLLDVEPGVVPIITNPIQLPMKLLQVN